MAIYLLALGALFSVINPLGTLPVFLGLTSDKTKSQINSTAFWSAINTFFILLIAFFAGKYILSFFSISINSLKIAGGLIITSSGFALLTGNFIKHKGMKKKEKEDASTRNAISLTPIAIPMLAGPGSISLLITYNHQYNNSLEQIAIIAAILSVCILTYFILRSSGYIVKLLGASGINALSRIIGFIVISIGVEYILSTVVGLVKGIIS